MDGALRTAKRLQQLLCKILSLVDFAQQLFLQMTPRSLFDRATLSDYALLLRVTFAPCSRFHRLRHVPDLGPVRADVSLFWFCVRIHDVMRSSILECADMSALSKRRHVAAVQI